jgi:N-acetylglucosamine-6-phosphate deacetylase
VRTVLTAAAAFTPLERIENPVVIINDGAIEQIGPHGEIEILPNSQRHNFRDAILAPGMLDLHIHGAVGHDVMTADDAGLASMEKFLAKHGVTSYCPTTITAPVENTLSALERLATRIERWAKDAGDEVRARAVGIHMEGPFLSYKKRGVHPAESLLPPDVKLFDRFWDAARGHIALMTVAPELPRAAELIAAAVAKGVTISLGHSDADVASTEAGIRAGARHATHTFNAMRTLHHREPGILGTVLTEDNVTADIIADGVHLSPSVTRLFLAAKREERAVLISDGLSATGMPDGRYKLGAFEFEVAGDRCTANGTLAGSVLTLDRAVRNIMKIASWSLQRALRLATANPAGVIRTKGAGVLAAGAPADIVVMSGSGEVISSFVNGRALQR